MDADTHGTKTEYSPLNNLSSSGEDVEQFSLPVTMSGNDRPKRRRKRKHFDSLKTSTMNSVNMARLCNCGSCFIAVSIVVLFVGICGLSIVVYYMSNNVAEMQKQIANLQVAKGSASSNLLTLQTKSENVDNHIQQLEILLKNHSIVLAGDRDKIIGLEAKHTSVETEIQSLKASSSSSNTGKVRSQLAQFGSDILTLKDDVASLKQKDISVEKRLSELDASIRDSAAIGQHAQSTGSPSVTADDAARLKALRLTVLSVNSTCSSGVSAIKNLLQTTDHAFSIFKTRARQEMTNLTAEVQVLKASLGAAAAAAASHNSTDVELIRRIDQLESYVRSLRSKTGLTEKLEDQVLNLTIASAMEDMIGRVIDKKTSGFHHMIDAIASRVASLEIKVSRIYNLSDHGQSVVPGTPVTTRPLSPDSAGVAHVTPSPQPRSTVVSVARLPSTAVPLSANHTASSHHHNISSNDLADLLSGNRATNTSTDEPPPQQPPPPPPPQRIHTGV